MFKHHARLHEIPATLGHSGATNERRNHHRTTRTTLRNGFRKFDHLCVVIIGCVLHNFARCLVEWLRWLSFNWSNDEAALQLLQSHVARSKQREHGDLRNVCLRLRNSFEIFHGRRFREIVPRKLHGVALLLAIEIPPEECAHGDEHNEQVVRTLRLEPVDEVIIDPTLRDVGALNL